MLKNFFKISVFSLLLIFAVPAFAQERMALTITPPLIKNNVVPGQIWKSYLKVVNNNPDEMDVYISLMNFESGSDQGTVRMTPLSREEIEADKFLINNWIVIEEGPHSIPAYQSREIPFIVDVPEQINPGGYRIAMLVGTRPLDDSGNGSHIKVSSMVSSLLFLNISGEGINESGIVREFVSDKNIYDNGQVELSLKFQNTGNSILQPQGEVRIYDFRDESLSVMPINHRTLSGNILPGDTRRWEFFWDVPEGLLKMGRYKAELILAYGAEKNRETIDMNIYFWVLKWKPLVFGVLSFIMLVSIIYLLIKRSIRRAVMNAQKELGVVSPSATQGKQQSVKKKADESGVLDLKVNINTTKREAVSKKPVKSFPGKLIVVFSILFLLVIVGLFIFYYQGLGKPVAVEQVQEEDVSLDMVDFDNANEVLFEEYEEDAQIIFEETQQVELELEAEDSKDEVSDLTINKNVRIEILNGSGRSGLAGEASSLVESDNYTVSKTGNADSFDYAQTVIRFVAPFEREAIEVGGLLGLELEYEEFESNQIDIQIIIGSDFAG